MESMLVTLIIGLILCAWLVGSLWMQVISTETFKSIRWLDRSHCLPRWNFFSAFYHDIQLQFRTQNQDATWNAWKPCDLHQPATPARFLLAPTTWHHLIVLSHLKNLVKIWNAQSLPTKATSLSYRAILAFLIQREKPNARAIEFILFVVDWEQTPPVPLILFKSNPEQLPLTSL